ncbi:hypothetical protein JVX90_02685 [Gordonia sp. PDNC005]|uniref:hypothetical protein n=1 Tax=unclassified Gordonia (in: high G+C Gram-positive bacteria) TaxID=2657482 RepID=UPI001965C392|nr:hypothetical protein [Gordonia sp. PDNC005]QRY63170.1 hypothetical protein JVX90_02685 [Gordonia sp. PDNC005]
MSNFGITPGQVAQIAADWRAGGEALSAERPSPPTGSGSSRVVAACATFCSAASKATTADANRLTALGDALARFDALTEESDRASAAALSTASVGGPR